MKGQRVGYIRVSTFEQKPDRQLESIQVDKIFTDKASGKDINRPQLDALLSFVREGDTVVIHSMDRLARNLDDLRSIVNRLTSKGIRVEFVKESLTFVNNDSPMANLMLSVMGVFAEFERALLKERQREGIELAKKRGIYKGRKIYCQTHRLRRYATECRLGRKKQVLLASLGSVVKRYIDI